MTKYIKPYAPIPMIPGPTTVPQAVYDAACRDFGSGQSEEDFLPFYHQTGRLLADLMGTQNEVVMMTGEAMLALWAALKSCLKPKDRVLSVGTGVFGDGIGEMAQSFGCEVQAISLPYSSTIGNGDSLERIETAIKTFKPKMLTAVHCETPSGTLNPLFALGEMKKRLGIPLFYVDAVASVGGTEVFTDLWNVDLMLTGSQKCLSAPASMSMIAVSPAAWDCMAQVKYQGYDSILPFKTIYDDGRCPYTPYWHGIAALNAAARLILAEGRQKAFDRHRAVAEQCRQGLKDLGFALFPAPDAECAPTVTAAIIPEGFTWQDWRAGLRKRGLVVAGSFGPMSGKVFRLGHMGAQADEKLMQKALGAIRETIRA